MLKVLRTTGRRVAADKVERGRMRDHIERSYLFILQPLLYVIINLITRRDIISIFFLC